jgi:hypothetical protein
LAYNESTFRDVNEALAADESGREVKILCECADAACVATISVTRAAYEEARSDPRLFLIARGHHARGEIEEIVAVEGDHELVRKFGEAAEIAEETDPHA